MAVLCIISFMEITFLVENNSRIDRYLLAEPALSIFIETEGKKKFYLIAATVMCLLKMP